MVIQHNNIKNSESFITYKGKTLQNVTEYKFLGSLLKNNGNLLHGLENLTRKGRMILFFIKAITASLGNLPVDVFKNLFDILVRPILTYNLEVSFMDGNLAPHRAINRGKKNGIFIY